MKLSICFFFLLTYSSTFSQTVPYKKYTTRDGLISDRVTAISQDEKGFIWFGSYYGICRYDGIKFEKIDLPTNQQNKYVTFITPAAGKVYAGFLFSGGLVEFSNGIIHSYHVRGKDSASANEFICVYSNKDGSILLCNSQQQLYHFKNGKFSLLYTIKNKNISPSQLIKDKYNNIWLASGQGICIIPYPYLSEYFYFNQQNVYSLVKDNGGRIWFSKTNGKTSDVISCDGWMKGNFINMETAGEFKEVRPVAFFGNVQNGIWNVDIYNGLINIRSNGKLAYYKVPLDYGTDMNFIFTDRENNVWIANEPGVWKVSNFNAQSYFFEELAVGGGGLQLLDSEIWATNSRSLYRLSLNSLQNKKFEPLNSLVGPLFIDSKKNVWIALWEDGIWFTRWKAGELIYKKFFLEYKGTRIKSPSIAEDAEGNIWIAGNNGIFRIKDQKVVDIYQPKSVNGQLASLTAMAIDEKNKILWLGDNATGIIKVHYQIRPGDKTHFRTDDYITNKDGLEDGSVRSLLYDGTDLWAGTRLKGIYRISRKYNKYKITNFTAAAGLSCTRVIDIKMQNHEAVWFATCNGIYRYSYSTDQWRHFNTSDGILNAEIFSIVVDEKNNLLWALTSQGVTKIELNSSEKPVAPLINIVAVTVLGKTDSTVLNSTFKRYSNHNNSIGFSFIGASFIDEKNIRYKYQLKGYDNDWSPPVSTNMVNYSSLPPGNYVFQVMAQNAKGQWSEWPASFSFEIVMPLYKRTWFIFLLIILAFTVIYLVHLHQLKNKFRIEKLRVAIARDLHDDVGSSLGSINLLSKTAERRLYKTFSRDELFQVFEKISQSAENTLEAMDDIVWSINPDRDKVQDLIIRMREFAIPLLEAADIGFAFNIEGGIDRAIPMNLRRNVFLIYKECIHNIIKHSEATKVDVRVQLSQNFSLKVTDNGKGFDLHLPTTRNGLKNMKQRAQSLNAKVIIESTAGCGTTISLYCPL